MTFLNSNEAISAHFDSIKIFRVLKRKLTLNEEFILKSMLIIGQENVFNLPSDLANCEEKIEQLLHHLSFVEQFYQPIGGIIGYHLKVLELLGEEIEGKSSKTTEVHYSTPKGLDIGEDSDDVRLSIRNGLENIDKLAFLLPVGGAGDRLGLLDKESAMPLPAAKLSFLGKTLLEGIIADITAYEELYYNLFGKRIRVPIAMMTSFEKNNDFYIRSICEENDWFGRDKDDFCFFAQPSVPLISEAGQWLLQDNLQLLLKPGGHGVIWKLASDNAVFDWLENKGSSKVLLRQINNPLAGEDNGLLAFIGYGWEKSFGFASCDRVVGMAEGSDILVEKSSDDGYEYSIASVEYTDFDKKGIADKPVSPDSNYSRFPCNSNILFADLKAVKEASARLPLPGLIINFKSKQDGIVAGRLESSMQNLSDAFVLQSKKQLPPDQLDDLESFITYNKRKKTISVVKNCYKAGEKIKETAESCLYDLLTTRYDLLNDYSHMQLPRLNSLDDYLDHGPSFLFLFNPLLGPFYSIIGQKIRGGRLHDRAELQLNIADINMENVDINGSLLIKATTPHLGKCSLKNISVINRGIDYTKNNLYWTNEIERRGKIAIILHGNGEFHAEDINFNGDITIEVPDGYRYTAQQIGATISYKKEKITAPTWQWHYSFDDDNRIQLQR